MVIFYIHDRGYPSLRRKLSSAFKVCLITVLVSSFIILIWCIAFKLLPKEFKFCLRVSEEKVGYLIYDFLSHNSNQMPSKKFLFFNDLIGELIILNRTTGASINKVYFELKKAIIRTIKERRRVKSVITSAVLQYSFMACLTWYLVLELSKQSGKISLLFTGLWQLLGLFVVIGSCKFYEKKVIFGYEPAFQSFYFLKTSLSVSVPLNEVLNRCLLLKSEQKGEFSVIRNRFLTVISRIKQSGAIAQEDVELLIEDLWHSYEVSLEKYQKLATTVKLVSFLCFILPCHFFGIISTLSQLNF